MTPSERKARMSWGEWQLKVLDVLCTAGDYATEKAERVEHRIEELATDRRDLIAEVDRLRERIKDCVADGWHDPDKWKALYREVSDG